MRYREWSCWHLLWIDIKPSSYVSATNLLVLVTRTNLPSIHLFELRVHWFSLRTTLTVKRTNRHAVSITRQYCRVVSDCGSYPADISRNDARRAGFRSAEIWRHIYYFVHWRFDECNILSFKNFSLTSYRHVIFSCNVENNFSPRFRSVI